MYIVCLYTHMCVLTINVHNLQVLFYHISLHAIFSLPTTLKWGYNRLRPNEIQHQLNEEKNCIYILCQMHANTAVGIKEVEKKSIYYYESRHNKRKLQISKK